jgi:predicted O-linked N-acetylglucosamine transferase (SPINDLY family)
MGNVKELYQKGISALASGDADLASIFLDRAIETGKAEPEIFANSGVINRELGNLETALDLLKIAVDREPDNGNFHYNLALVYGDLGQSDFAENHYQMAIGIIPDMVAAHNNLGNINKNKKKYNEALSFYKQAIKIDPNYIPAYRNLADLYETSGDHLAAKNVYSEAIYLRPDTGLRIREALVLPVIVDSKEQILECRKQLISKLDNLLNDGLTVEDPIREVGATNFLLPYHGLDDKEIQVKISEMYLKVCPSLVFEAPHVRGWMAGLEGGVPRIGFVSSFFHDHTISMLNKSLINGLPKARFEVFIFSFSRVEDSYVQGFKTGSPKFISLPKRIDDARQRIAEAELDILYFTDIGMEPLTYFLGFSRLAPVQCVTWGHPVTTGLPNIDYFVSSNLIEPENAQASYSEKLIKLNSLPSCIAKPNEFKNILKQERSNGQRIFCPQSLFKYHPDFDKILGKILRALPDATIQIIDGSHPSWSVLLKTRMLKQTYDVSDRIEILPRRNKKEIADLMRAADVILDTPHFSGGMTTFEALAAGTPVVTLPGEFMRSRVSFGVYKQMNMMDCVSEDTEGYIEITKRLCLDNNFAKMVRTQITEGQLNIFDNRTVIDGHAKFFEKVMFE